LTQVPSAEAGAFTPALFDCSTQRYLGYRATVTHSHVDGKFLSVDGRRFLIKGVSYGTFAPDERGVQFPSPERIAQDFALMSQAGINTVRTYTAPSIEILDEAARHGLRLMIGLPWSQHIAFLDDRSLERQIRREIAGHVRSFGSHPAALLFTVGNEIPPSVVRWHGQSRIERFLRELYEELKAASPNSLFTYVNYPPTEYLDTECYDVQSFNVYLHREESLRAYVARLQQIAGNKPLLLAEAGGDSIREGLEGQASITAMHLRAAFEEGLAGAVAFSWTDEWWRGGHDVTDWAFGLVDRERQPKPALAAVADAFAQAPFSTDAQKSWPKVSVLVCAYNAADTLDDCLLSLQQLTYPDYEVIVVNDGSRDRTGEIAHSYPGVRVVDVMNGGLSAARNVALAAATGEIVAYTDADVRVDPDWLTYLVQPFLRSGVVGSGGPNIVPPDDPWMAQCVARAPGGPTHVLLDDRIAEHVPGCNMAYRRDALLAIGGFNPVYLRAGDDVDVCWRLQAKGQKIGFAPAALVWHHHRASVKAYWRQQVGYGEGETWLDAHHPEKFVRGNMVWRGRIYSALPFVRSLSGRRINTGVWGTAAFPSVYRTDVHSFQFLPHQPVWLAVSTVCLIAGAIAALAGYVGASTLLVAGGATGWTATIVRCVLFGWNSDLAGVRSVGTEAGRWRHRALIAWMHFIQPFARSYGRMRGLLSPPLVVELNRVTRLPWRPSNPTTRDVMAATLVLFGGASEENFWGETWTSNDTFLTEIAGLLRASRPAQYVVTDDGWRADRDVSVALGHWGWLDLRALIEEHGGPKVLLRVATRLRPTQRGVVLALALAAFAVTVTSAAVALRWPLLSIASAAGVGVVVAHAIWQATKVVCVSRQAMLRATAAAGMIPMEVRDSGKTRRFSPRPTSVPQAVQAGVAAALATSAVLTGTSVARDVVAEFVRNSQRPVQIVTDPRAVRPVPDLEGASAVATAPNGDLVVADTRRGVIRRLDPRALEEPQTAGLNLAKLAVMTGGLPFASPTDIAVASNGDIYVADAQNHRICRIDRLGKITTVAGNGNGAFDGDQKQATQAALNMPGAIAVGRNGDLYIADTANHRIRVVSQTTGMIKTIAGDGNPGDGDAIGDGGPATRAHLDSPTDVVLAPNGDVYVADLGHSRVRRIDVTSGVITTVAGNGTWGAGGDNGPAVSASLSGPVGLALTTTFGRQVTVYIADYYNGSIRVVNPSGVISTLGAPKQFPAPSRLAYRVGGWLYVASDSGAVTAVNVNKGRPYQLATVAHRTKKVT
jgi:GT2 family glycosyltransferase